MELAERLGRTLGELLDGMTSWEVTQWLALARVRHVEEEHERTRERARQKMRR